MMYDIFIMTMKNLTENAPFSLGNGYNEADRLALTAVRMLAVDMVEKAKSGHPGMPLGAAPMAYVLWTQFLKHNPKDPGWINRDRFFLSAGHGSALIYALLHLAGYDLSIDELKNFRQWGSKTPGHPEAGHVPGIECTTGPLGQGFAMGVGMALAQEKLSRAFDREAFPVMEHFTYGIVSDGDLMEGVASEAASLAAHNKLGRLIYLYDDNKISIEGSTSITFTEDVERRFAAYGWHTQRVSDGNDLAAIEAAITTAQRVTDKPSLILVRTHIGFGSPKQDTKEVHGEPLGADAMKATRESFDWPHGPFQVPDAALNPWRQCLERNARYQQDWKTLWNNYCEKFPQDGAELIRRLKGVLPTGWDKDIPAFTKDAPGSATRESSGVIMNAISKYVPELVGGSADLAPSTKTWLKNRKEANLNFGVREFAMGAAVNGMAMHGGFIPYGSTFLVFSDYMRGAIRLAALQKAHSLFIFTHDSIALGEDGPTHQPIEHIASLRAIPGLVVLRPADANETAAAWRVAMTLKRPVAFALTRQKVAVLDDATGKIAQGAAKGAYILQDSDSPAEIVLIATGSEVHTALEACKILTAGGRHARVVSMPSWELFSEQPASYQDTVLPPTLKRRLSIEAGSTMGWHRWVGSEGDTIGIDHFGASAPAGVLLEKYGFSAEHIAQRALKLLNR